MSQHEAITALIKLGWRRAAADHFGMLARLGFFVLILGIFAAIFENTPVGEASVSGLTAAHLIWYLTVTEIVVLAPGYPSRAIEVDIQSGDIAAGLLRPVSYGIGFIAEQCGTTLYRVLVMSVTGAGAAYVLSGVWLIPPWAPPFLVLAIVLGCAMIVLVGLPVGYTCAWFGASGPAFLIWQKSLFVFGGLMLPLTLYPDALESFARATPFAAILYAPASVVLPGFTAVNFAGIFASQVMWLGFFVLLAWGIDRAALHRFTRRGT